MNNTKLPSSLDDTTELKKLILENPDAPLIIFAGEEAWSDNYCYEQVDAPKENEDELKCLLDFLDQNNLPKVELPQWHDLKKNPDDLPKNLEYVLTKKNKSISIMFYSTATKRWYQSSGTLSWSRDMIDKWAKLPKDEG